MLIAARIARCDSVAIYMPDDPELHAMLQSEWLALLASPPCNLPSIALPLGEAPVNSLSLEVLCWVRDDEGHDFYSALVNEAMGTIVVLSSFDGEHTVEGAEIVRGTAIALK